MPAGDFNVLNPDVFDKLPAGEQMDCPVLISTHSSFSSGKFISKIMYARLTILARVACEMLLAAKVTIVSQRILLMNLLLLKLLCVLIRTGQSLCSGPKRSCHRVTCDLVLTLKLSKTVFHGRQKQA